jgi:hypothetical protein
MAQVVAEEDLAAAEVQRLSGLMEEAAAAREHQAEAEVRPFLGEEEVQRQKPGRS